MAVVPTGAQHEITAGPYRAVVTEVGGALRALTHDGRDLVVPFGEDEPRRLYRGAVLAPWPNRVGDGRYTWASTAQQLALSEPDRRCAIHGLVAWLPWSVAERTASSLALTARVWPQEGYPHAVDLRVTYALDDDGLAWALEATGAGGAPAPYGCSVHPYLVAGPGRVDDWTLELDAARVLPVDPDRLLPLRGTRTDDVTGTDLDFRGGRALRGTAVDHALTGVGAASATVRAADGTGVRMTWDGSTCPWVQVHTADRPEPADDRVGLAVEPMTCPPDALRSGTDLVELAPGATHRTTWRIGAVGAAGAGR